MFGIDSSELLLVAVVALVVIGPKDLPKAMRVIGYWVGRARGVSRQFRSGFDAMIREAELAEMEKRWAEENERIMREHAASPTPEPADGFVSEEAQNPVTVDQPTMRPSDDQSAPPGDVEASVHSNDPAAS